MITLLKLIRGLLKGVASATAPWQLALGVWFGVLLGFLPIFPAAGPSPLGFLLLFLAVVLNCHLASVLLFMGLTKLLALGLKGVGLTIGDSLSSFAQTCGVETSRTVHSTPLRSITTWGYNSSAAPPLAGNASISASAAVMADRSTAASMRGAATRWSRCGVRELSKLWMRGNDTRASTPSDGAHK